MIGDKVIQRIVKIVDSQLQGRAQKLLDKHLQNVDKIEKPYVSTRIGFGASIKEKVNA
jgi:hypothetical protein